MHMPPQRGVWTLIAPDGRTWKADTPIRTVLLEQLERASADEFLTRVLDSVAQTEAEKLNAG
jgi:hypothetical protein